MAMTDPVRPVMMLSSWVGSVLSMPLKPSAINCRYKERKLDFWSRPRSLAESYMKWTLVAPCTKNIRKFS